MNWKVLLFLHSLLFTGLALGNNKDITLECLPNSIRITFTNSYFTSNSIEVISGQQIHVNSYPQCHADQVENGYVLTLYQPFSGCGTPPEHENDNYVYRNVIVFSRLSQSSSGQLTQLTTKGLLNFTCDYEDKYVVSSDFGINPDVRTLNFATARGTLAVEMNLYQRSDYHPKSKLGNSPKIIVGVPIYVSVDMVNVFGENDIAMTMQTCYATTSENFGDVPGDNFHHLIIGRCASPNDGTVRIYSNGVGFRSRFSFQMFQWKDGMEYVYLHCEVQVCNKTEENCAGSGKICTGLENEDSSTSRRKRDTPKVQGNTGFISLGPIAMAKLQNGKATYVDMENGDIPGVEVTEKNQKLLLAYIFGSIAVVLVVVGIALFVLVIYKKSANKSKIATPPSYRSPSPLSYPGSLPPSYHSPSLSSRREKPLPLN